MNTSELFETVDQKLSGYLDISGLAKLLPDLTDVNMFDETLGKIRLGQGDNLTVPEKTQLSLAFISLVGLNNQQKSQVMRFLSASQAAPALPTQGQQGQTATANAQSQPAATFPS